MINMIRENLGTIVISAVLLCVVFMIIRNMIQQKKKGGGCSGGCPGCGHAASCSSSPQKK